MNTIVIPGDPIVSEITRDTGHGVLRTTAGSLIASLPGQVVETANIVYVESTAGRYAPKTGDLVIGRITAVTPAGWSVDVGAGGLLLLPFVDVATSDTAVVERATEALIRRQFTENTLIILQVSAKSAGGRAGLVIFGAGASEVPHGRLQHGHLVHVSHALVKQTVPVAQAAAAGGACSVTVAVNGRVWVGGMDREVPLAGVSAEDRRLMKCCSVAAAELNRRGEPISAELICRLGEHLAAGPDSGVASVAMKTE